MPCHLRSSSTRISLTWYPEGLPGCRRRSPRPQLAAAAKPEFGDFQVPTAPSPWVQGPWSRHPGRSRTAIVEPAGTPTPALRPVPARRFAGPASSNLTVDRSALAHGTGQRAWGDSHAWAVAERGRRRAPVAWWKSQPQTSPKRCMWGTLPLHDQFGDFAGAGCWSSAGHRLRGLKHMLGDWATQFGMLNHHLKQGSPEGAQHCDSGGIWVNLGGLLPPGQPALMPMRPSRPLA